MLISAMPPLRVVVVEDSLVYREGLVSVLVRAGCTVAAEAGDVAGGISAVARERPDCAILDVRMPPTHTDEGLELARALRDAHPRVGLLLLSNHLEEDFALQLVERWGGGVGYLLKDSVRSRSIVLDALQRVVAHETVVDAAIVDALMRRRQNHDALGRLTPAERRVLALVAEGRSNDAVAASLVVSPRTVNAHVRSIMRKLDLDTGDGIDRRVAAALRWLEGGTRVSSSSDPG